MNTTYKVIFGLVGALFLGTAALTLSGSTAPSKSSSPLQPKHFSSRFCTPVSVRYFLYLPPQYNEDPNRKWPLMLFLHGAGERGSDLELVARHGPPKLVRQGHSFPFLIVAPQCPKGRIWDNNTLLALLDHILHTYRVDPKRVYLTGLSMGGFGTWSLGLAHPERFAAIVPICGGGNPISIFLAGGRWAEELRRLPVWAFHGAKDPIVPVQQSKQMVQALRRLGNTHVRLTIYPEAGHDAWTQTSDNPPLYKWLLQQHR